MARSRAGAQRDVGPRRSVILLHLPPELLAEIHGRLDFVDRLNLAVSCRSGGEASSSSHKTPCLVLPGATTETATLFSLPDGRFATSRAADPAMRGHVILGSTDGWIVTADVHATLRIANPVTGEQAELPAITTGTIPFVDPILSSSYAIDMNVFSQLTGAHNHGSITLSHCYMRKWFYRKVILSASPRPGSYAAMLILDKPRFHGAAAFATADEQSWRLAFSPDGVEDAIHHDGRFYSITYSGYVVAIRPRLPGEDLHMKPPQAFAFEVLVLDVARQRWVETKDIGDLALFVGVNTSLCVSTRDHPGIRAGTLGCMCSRTARWRASTGSEPQTT
nr:unnamed protein product [Digitaria exilis]